MRSLNIFNYFPIRDEEHLNTFLKKDDDFEERKRLMFQIIIPAITDDKTKFANAVIRRMFSIPYLIAFRWPTVG